MVIPLVYIDTCILSRISDQRHSAAAAKAYADIANSGALQLVTSDKTRVEVLQTKDPTKNSLLQFLVALVRKVPLKTLHLSGAIGAAPVGATPLGGGWTDPLLTKLQRIFDLDDAEHIALAVNAGCLYFLTLDRATILDRVGREREQVRALCGEMEFVSPEQLALDVQVS